MFISKKDIKTKLKLPVFQKIITEMKSRLKDDDFTNIICYKVFLSFIYEDLSFINENEIISHINHCKKFDKYTKGLVIYENLMNLSISYYYGKDILPKNIKTELLDAILFLSDFTENHGGGEMNPSFKSNWQGIRWSSVGFSNIILGRDEKVVKSFIKILKFIEEYNLSKGSGWCSEGQDYNSYSWCHICPFLALLEEYEPNLKWRKEYNIEPILLTSYLTITFREYLDKKGLGIHNIVSTNKLSRRGFLPLAFHFCDKKLLPGIKYCFDRTQGELGDNTFSRSNIGLIFTFLYYPYDIESKNPLEIPSWKSYFNDIDGQGTMVDRDRYNDENDIVSVFHYRNDLVERRSWASTSIDDMTFKVCGYDTSWIIGAGKVNKEIVNSTVFSDFPSVDLFRKTGLSVEEHYVEKEEFRSIYYGKLKESKTGVINWERCFMSDVKNSIWVVNDISDNGRYISIPTSLNLYVNLYKNEFTIVNKNNGMKLHCVFLNDVNIETHLFNVSEYYNNGVLLSKAKNIICEFDKNNLMFFYIAPENINYKYLFKKNILDIDSNKYKIGKHIQWI